MHPEQHPPTPQYWAPPPPPPPPPPPAPPRDRSRHTLLGLLLVVPAFLGLIVSHVVPTVRTVRASLTDANLLTEPTFVGLANYAGLGGELPAQYAFALSLAAGPLLAVLVVAPVLAYTAHRAGRGARWTVRAALALPVVCYTPAVVALAWTFHWSGEDTPGESPLADPTTAPAAVALALGLATFGLACGVGVTGYLAALHRRDGGSAAAPMVTAGAVLAVAIVAVALQEFSFPRVMSGGAAATTRTPVVALWERAFVEFDVGGASAEAVVLLAILMSLGLVATLVILATGTRLDVAPRSRATTAAGSGTGVEPGSGVAAAGAGLLLLGVLALAGYGLWPWLSLLVGTPAWSDVTATVLVNTWLPPLVSTVVGVGCAALAGFGIGALRPLGSRSPLLLLPFAPWLFVGLGPLVPAHYVTASDRDLVGTYFLLVPQVWIAIPALFLFALLFHGQQRRHRALVAAGALPGAARARLLAPALPMVALVGAATWVVQSQGLLWPLTVAFDPRTHTGPLQVVMGAQAGAPPGTGLSAALSLVAVVLLAVALAAVQVRYLDRTTLRVGRDESAAAEPGGHDGYGEPAGGPPRP